MKKRETRMKQERWHNQSGMEDHQHINETESEMKLERGSSEADRAPGSPRENKSGPSANWLQN